MYINLDTCTNNPVMAGNYTSSTPEAVTKFDWRLQPKYYYMCSHGFTTAPNVITFPITRISRCIMQYTYDRFEIIKQTTNLHSHSYVYCVASYGTMDLACARI